MKDRRTLFIRDLSRKKNMVDEPTPSHRPMVRGECQNAQRPCPFVTCRHHLFVDVTHAGSIKLPFGDQPQTLHDMAETCSLDVADRGGHDMGSMGRYLGVTAARVQQEVVDALAKVRAALEHDNMTYEDLTYEPPGYGQEGLSMELLADLGHGPSFEEHFTPPPKKAPNEEDDSDA